MASEKIQKIFSFVTIIICILLNILIFSSIKFIYMISHNEISIFVIFIMFCILYALAMQHDKYIWSISNIFIIVYCIFHFGLVFIYITDKEYFIGNTLSEWWFRDDVKFSILLSIIGLNSYAIGSSIANFLSNSNEICKYKNYSKYINNNLLQIVGFCFVSITVFVWYFLMYKNGGIRIFTVSYSSYLKESENFLSQWYYFYFTGIGLIFLLLTNNSKLKKIGLIIYACYALSTLAIGLRGQILFPLFAAVSVFYLKKTPPSLVRTFVIGVCLLAVISAIKQIRQVGLANVEISQISMLPSDGLGELGGSLRPVAEVVSWSRNGDPYMYGASYWAPFDRSLVYFIPGWTRPDASEDNRLLGIQMGKRAGSVGFSIIAEAFINFGEFGVFLVMLLLGYIIGKIAIWPQETYYQIKAAVIILPLLMHIRNSFIFVPANIIIGLILLEILYVVSNKYEILKETS